MTNTAIFIDYDNVFDIIEKKYNPENKIDIHLKFIEELWTLYKDDNILKFVAYADYTKVNKDTLITELQKRGVKLEHCYSNGNKEEKYRKNASDLALCIGVMKNIYEKPEINKYVLVSSDCDMIPILNELKFKDKQTVHIFSPTSSNKDIREYDKEKPWSVVNDFKYIEDVLGVKQYEDTVKDLELEGYKDIAKSVLPQIFDNINYQRSKDEFIYGFGYLRDDIVKVTKKVKEDATKIAQKFKELEIVVVVSRTEQGFENFRLNKDNEWVKKFLSEQISQDEFKDIFLLGGSQTQ